MNKMCSFCRTDVTAVKMFADSILAGIGSYLHVFDKQSTTFLYKLKCLNGQKIYGIIPSKDRRKLLIFGGKQFTILSVEDGRYRKSLEPVVCDDWMISGVWIGEETMVLLSAHNVVQKWHISPPTLLASHASPDNSILYSGLLIPTADDDIVVFAGTVYSEVIVHCCGNTLHRLTGHRGVIFSISCDPIKETIVTTSDDRSVRIWKINNKQNHAKNTKLYWENEITCHQEVYGHSARVMRSCITNDVIVSVGEDSAICFWDDDGKLLRKVMSHQNGSIWAVDCDDKYLVTGGGDCGVIKHPLTIAKEYGQKEVLNINAGTPKKVLFTARRNLVILNDNNEVIYYDVEEKSKMIYKLNHESTYKLLSISSCKQIIAVADMNGKLDIFTENSKDKGSLLNVVDAKLQIGKIMSMHWAGNRHLVFCSDNGLVTVLAQNRNKTEVYTNLLLPQCKERWLTAAALNQNQKILILGDRCGNIHIYVQNRKDPIKSFSKVHGRYGPTTITIKENRFLSTGRDGTVKLFSFNNDLSFTFMNARELEFNWVEKFLDKNESLVCGFQERLFVIYYLETNTKVLEIQCGGGHRSWDAVRYFEKIDDEYEECIKLVFVKNSDIQSFVFQLSKIVSKNIVNGSHSKEINCMKIFKTNTEESMTYYISGAEDTTLRISSVNKESYFQEVILFKHLSSVRTLKTITSNNDKLILISAGGRAQICVKAIIFQKINDEMKVSSQELVNYMVKGTDKERKGNLTWRNCTIDFDPETRIMDFDYLKVDYETYLVFTGCSDACIRIFILSLDPKTISFKPIKQIEQHKTCILKTKFITISNKNLFISCTTRGEIAFWEVNYSKESETLQIDSILTINTNKSGINGLDTKMLTNKSFIIATAGDDNAIHLNIIELTDQSNLASLKVTHSWHTDNLYSSQITGLILLDDMLISTSIDQRVTICSWSVGKEICCKFMSQTLSDVADIHGIELVDCCRNSVTVCVYGKGIEVINMPIDRT